MLNPGIKKSGFIVFDHEIKLVLYMIQKYGNFQ